MTTITLPSARALPAIETALADAYETLNRVRAEIDKEIAERKAKDRQVRWWQMLGPNPLVVQASQMHYFDMLNRMARFDAANGRRKRLCDLRDVCRLVDEVRFDISDLRLFSDHLKRD